MVYAASGRRHFDDGMHGEVTKWQIKNGLKALERRLNEEHYLNFIVSAFSKKEIKK